MALGNGVIYSNRRCVWLVRKTRERVSIEQVNEMIAAKLINADGSISSEGKKIRKAAGL